MYRAVLVLIGFVFLAFAQSDAERAVQLALDGRCPETMPLLKEAMGQVRDDDLKRKVGKGGVRCAMLMILETTATRFSGLAAAGVPARSRCFCSWQCTSIRIWPN